MDFPSGNSFVLLMTLWRSGRWFSRCRWVNLGTDDLVKQIHSTDVQKIQPKQRYLSKDFAHITQQYLILYVIQCTELFFTIRSRNNQASSLAPRSVNYAGMCPLSTAIKSGRAVCTGTVHPGTSGVKITNLPMTHRTKCANNHTGFAAPANSISKGHFVRFYFCKYINDIMHCIVIL